MKTLIINGSPRKNGDTIALISEMKNHLGCDITIIDTYYTDIKPCNDCRYCWEHSACAIKDGMQNVFELINDADNIVIASPIYFSELSGSLLNFASRLQYIYATKNIRHEKALQEKKRNGIVFLVGGGDGSSEQPLKTAKLLLRIMGAEYLDMVCSHHTDRVPAKDDMGAMEKVREIADYLKRGD